MDGFCETVKDKLEEYDYNLYDVSKMKRKREYRFMTDHMIIYADGKDNSLTVSFQVDSSPEIVAHDVMILNEIKGLNIVYVSESYYFDRKNKKYVTGKEANEMLLQEIANQAAIKIAKEQLYSHILTTQKCHEC
jgi:hypothetical protein